MNNDLYYATRDYQTDDFGFYRAYTIEEWREQALDWSDTDGTEERTDNIKHLPKKYVLDYIQDVWTIKIDKADKDSITKFFIENSDLFNRFIRIIEQSKKLLKDNNIKFDEKDYMNEIYFKELDRAIEYFNECYDLLYKKEEE